MLRIEHLTKKYGDKKAVDDLSLHIQKGEIYGFIGHNGAGKTTTIKSCCGILNFDEGEIYVDGVSVKEKPLECKRKIAYIPDNPDLYEFMTGIKYLNFIADIFGISQSDRQARISKYAEMFEIKNALAQTIDGYSHGMKQKLAIVSALIHNPKLIIMDEPFVGLDPKSSHLLKALMREMCDNGGAIFFSTHVLEVAEKLCDKVAIIKSGKLIKSGTMDEVKGDDSLEDVYSLNWRRKMLKTLIKLQFQKALARYTANSSNKKKNGKKSSFNSPAVYLALLAFVGVVFAFMFYNMFSMMAPMLATSGFSWLYFLYVMGASFVISTIGCIFLSLSQLYEAKDNELLLSMPIPPRSILFCRMLPLYAQNLLFCALVQVPAFAAYATNASVSVSLVVSQIVILLLVPLLSLSVSCVLGWLIAFVTSRTRHKNVVTIVFSLVFFALYFYLYYQAEDLVKTLAANSIGIGANIMDSAYPLYLTGLGASGDLLPLFGVAVVIIAFFAIVYAVLSHSFIKLATAKKGAKKAVYKEKTLKVSSASKALLRKERMMFTGNATYMLNSGLSALIMVGGTIYAVFQLNTLKQFPSTLIEMISVYLPLVIAFVISMGPISAASISMEAKNLWLMQSLPVSPLQVLTQKLKLHFIVNGVVSLVPSVVLSIMLGMKPVNIIITILIPIIFSLFSGLLGLMFDLKKPKLDWNTTAEAVKQSASVMLSLLISVLAVCVPAIAYPVLLSFEIVIPTEIFLACTAFYFILISLPIWYWIKNKGTKVFANL